MSPTTTRSLKPVLVKRRPNLWRCFAAAAVAGVGLHAWSAEHGRSHGNEGWTSLFDGRSLAGWEGNQQMFRVQNGAIVGGTLAHEIPHNEFLCTTQTFADFELRLECKVAPATANAGIQFRSRRKPDHHEVIGYQADIGAGWWGKLYDESRRNRILAEDATAIAAAHVRPETWNRYRIRCEGPRIRLWLNDQLTVDYTELDDQVARQGIIGLQIHGGPAAEAHYRNLEIRQLGAAPADAARPE